MAIEISAPKAQAVSEAALVAAKFPERDGLIRKIHRLWAGAYRVNYHDPDGNHFIVESWYVIVEGNHVRGRRG